MFKIFQIKHREFNDSSYDNKEEKISKQHYSTSTNFPPLTYGHKKTKYHPDHSCQSIYRSEKENEYLFWENERKSAFLMDANNLNRIKLQEEAERIDEGQRVSLGKE